MSKNNVGYERLGVRPGQVTWLTLWLRVASWGLGYYTRPNSFPSRPHSFTPFFHTPNPIPPDPFFQITHPSSLPIKDKSRLSLGMSKSGISSCKARSTEDSKRPKKSWFLSCDDPSRNML